MTDVVVENNSMDTAIVLICCGNYSSRLGHGHATILAVLASFHTVWRMGGSSYLCTFRVSDYKSRTDKGTGQ